MDSRSFYAVFRLGEFSKVLDGTNHLAGIAVLVVIPSNNLYLIGIVVDLGNHRLGGIEQGTVLHADYIGRNDLIFVVAEGFGGGGLHSGVDGILGYVLALNNSHEDGGGTSRNRNRWSSERCSERRHEHDGGHPCAADHPGSSGRRCKHEPWS